MSMKIIEGADIRVDTPLWRYMELSKFMMLLAGKVFIPTLGTLKKDADPKEAILPSRSELYLPELLFEGGPGEGFRNWAALRGEESHADKERRIRQSDQAKRANADPRAPNDILYDEWLRCLSARRAIWCWGSTPDLRATQEPWENLAMWNSYARSGVAIKTTFQGIQNAVAASSDLKAADAIALKVRYLWQGYDIHELFEDERLKRPFRPFALKQKSYEFESEVRIVFRIDCHRDSPPGVVVDVNPSVLLDGGEVVLSPYLQREEAHAVATIIKRHIENERVTVRGSAEREEVGPEITEWTAHLGGSPSQWGKRFEMEGGLPDLLSEL